MCSSQHSHAARIYICTYQLFFSRIIVMRQATRFMCSLHNVLNVSIFVSVKTLDGKSPVQGHSATERWSLD